MPESILPKFNIGEKVQTSDGEVCKVLSHSYEPSLKTFRYMLESKELDIPNKKILTGIKTCLESELEVEKKGEQPNE